MNPMFWVITSYTPVNVHRNFGGRFCPHVQVRRVGEEKKPIASRRQAGFLLLFYPEYGSNTFFRNLMNIC
jgi:hypothetical protein